MAQRCLICSRVIEPEKNLNYNNEDEAGKKPSSICQLCQAKLKHEAEESQKTPKPM